MLPPSSRLLLPVMVIACALPAPAMAQDAAVAPVQSLCDGLLAIMKGGKAMGAAGRAERIGPAIDRAFDLAAMTRIAVGPAWTGWSPADQQAVVAAFRRMTIAQYAANFDSWSGESFTVDPAVETRGADKLVKTQLVQAKGASEPLSYRLRQSGGQWRIIDVFYRNSISQLATRRSDFARIVATGGAKALVQHLDSLAAKGAG